MAASISARLEKWWQARIPRQISLTLNYRNVYILPTRAGWMLCVTLIVLLVASINYQLNLGYLLTFLLAGCAIVALHISHANLSGLGLSLQTPQPAFAQARSLLAIKLDNPSRRCRYALALAVHGSQDWIYTDVPAQSLSLLQLAWQPPKRGWQSVPMLSAKTLFPLGTFRAWALWQPDSKILVYPQPEALAPALPQNQQHGSQVQHRSASQLQSELDHLRPYRSGDPLKNILWKQAAKTGALISRSSPAASSNVLWLDQQLTALSRPEQQLSRLCAWVLQADQLGLRYGLRLNGHSIEPDCGPLHRERCLRSLALA